MDEQVKINAESQEQETKQDLKVWGVKVTDDVKIQMQDLLKSEGLTGNDLINEMLTLYIKSQTNNNVRQGMQTLTTATKQILNTYKAISDQMQFSEDDLRQQHHQEQERLKGEMVQLQVNNATIQEDLKELKKENETLEGDKKVLLKDIGMLQETNTSNKGLIESKEKEILNLSSLLDQYKQHQKENIKLSQVNNQLQQDQQQAQQQVKDLQKQLQEQEKQSNQEIETLKNKLMLQCKEEKLSIQQHHQEELQKTRDDYNLKVASLLERLQKQNVVDGGELGKVKK